MNTSSDKDFLRIIKNVGGGIASVIGFITTVIAFLKLVEGSKGVTTITTLICGIGVIEIVLLHVYYKKRKPEDNMIVPSRYSFDREEKWNYSRNRRRMALSLAVTLPILISLIAGICIYRPNTLTRKFIVLIANFDGPNHDKYRPTEILIGRLREANRKYSEVEVRALSQSITEQQGSAEARRIGEEHNANIVLWGWYGQTSSNVLFTVHFEILSSPKILELEHDNQTFNVTLGEMERFEIQTSLSNEMTYLTLLVTGMVRYEAEDYSSAIERFTDALGLPRNPQEVIDPSVIYLYRGNSFFFKHNLDDAIADLNKALSINPHWGIAYNNRGVAYEDKGDHDKAIADYNRALSINPDDAGVYCNRGKSYEKEGAYDLAISDYNAALRINPNYSDAFNNRGITYGLKGDYDSSIADFNKALRLKPKDFGIYYNRGISYGEKGDYGSAIDDFNTALSIKPDYVSAYFNRGNTYERKGEYDLSIADFNKVLSVEPNKARAYVGRGAGYRGKGETDLAIADFNRALSLEPDDAVTLNNRGLAYYDKKDDDLALADINKSLSLKPDYAAAYNSRGIIYGTKGDYDLAIADFSKALSLKPNIAAFYQNRGRAYRLKGEDDLATADFKKASEIDRANTEN